MKYAFQQFAIMNMVLLCNATANALPHVVTEDYKLLASDGIAGDDFGKDVCISGSTIIVGADFADAPNTSSGAAYIYRFTGGVWIEEAKLSASDHGFNDFYGDSVSISGERAIVGAHNNTINGLGSGSAYMYHRENGNWIEKIKLLPSDGSEYDFFGHSVSISGDVVIVGADGDSVHGAFSGSAYIFRFNGSTWVEEAKLTPKDGAASDHFGIEVSVLGTVAVVCARYDDDAGLDSGSVYIYRYDGSAWNQETKLVASDGAQGDHFGSQVGMSGDAIIIGSRWNDGGSEDTGAAYVFRFDGSAWNEEAKLFASDGADADYFSRCAIFEDYAIVGASNSDDSGIDSGSAYIFQFDGAAWNEVAKLLASDASERDRLGYGVYLTDTYAIVGASYEDSNGENAGSAYILDLTVDSDGDGTPDFIDNCELANADQADCNNNGIGDMCEQGDPCQCIGDIDIDGFVNVTDLLIVIQHWGELKSIADLNNDGIVDVADLLVVISNWGPCD